MEYANHNKTSSKIEELIEKCLEFVYLNTNQTISATPSFSSVGDLIMRRWALTPPALTSPLSKLVSQLGRKVFSLRSGASHRPDWQDKKPPVRQGEVCSLSLFPMWDLRLSYSRWFNFWQPPRTDSSGTRNQSDACPSVWSVRKF